ncbi:hypothetical protein LJR219_003958 [Phenylobacterium sp. LjRoot219]|uniref:hypothetical protein n=1 Tax=Phenylobacterium sp. LjRoot219 TaxID=3342283 RepID=UPI003ECDF229
MALAVAFMTAQAAACATPADQDAGWSVTAGTGPGPVMTRTIPPVTIYYRVTVDEYNLFTPTLTLTVADCGDKPWSKMESVDPQGDSPAARAAEVRELISKELADAADHCPLPGGIAARLLEGFEAAYAQFEASKK